MSFGSILKTMFGPDGMPQQGADPRAMSPEERAKYDEAQRQGANSNMYDALARSFFESGQAGSMDGSNVMDMAKAYSQAYSSMADGAQTKPQSAVQSLLGVDPSQLPQKTAPVAPAPPPQTAFNVTPASGGKVGNYRPTQLSFTAPQPSVLAAMGLPQQNAGFEITPASGTKAKNYRPMQMAVNAPQPAGPDVMAQIMAAMNSGGITPFAPYGQG